jgi:hypothetical protein
LYETTGAANAKERKADVRAGSAQAHATATYIGTQYFRNWQVMPNQLDEHGSANAAPCGTQITKRAQTLNKL